LYCLLPIAFLLSSCQNKTKNLLAKKWDCVQIENLAPVDTNVFSKEDSAAAAKIKMALQSLVWTFNDDNSYQCSVGNTITVQGTYAITDDNKTLTLVSAIQNNTNTYAITTLTPTDMVLTASGTTVPLILRFRVH
jgi:Lipocalin-like domain (DUF4923)